MPQSKSFTIVQDANGDIFTEGAQVPMKTFLDGHPMRHAVQ